MTFKNMYMSIGLKQHTTWGKFDYFSMEHITHALTTWLCLPGISAVQIYHFSLREGIFYEQTYVCCATLRGNIHQLHANTNLPAGICCNCVGCMIWYVAQEHTGYFTLAKGTESPNEKLKQIETHKVCKYW